MQQIVTLLPISCIALQLQPHFYASACEEAWTTCNSTAIIGDSKNEQEVSCGGCSGSGERGGPGGHWEPGVTGWLGRAGAPAQRWGAAGRVQPGSQRTRRCRTPRACTPSDKTAVIFAFARFESSWTRLLSSLLLHGFSLPGLGMSGSSFHAFLHLHVFCDCSTSHMAPLWLPDPLHEVVVLTEPWRWIVANFSSMTGSQVSRIGTRKIDQWLSAG